MVFNGGFAKFRVRPKNKNTPLGPFDRQKHQHFVTIRTGIRAMPSDVQGLGGKKRQLPLQCTCKEKTKV